MYSIDQYSANGFSSPIRVMTESRSTDLAHKVQNLRNTNPNLAERALGTNCHLLFPWLHEVTQMTEILDEVEKVIGTDILLWSASFFIKDFSHVCHFMEPWKQQMTIGPQCPFSKVWICISQILYFMS